MNYRIQQFVEVLAVAFVASSFFGFLIFISNL